MAQTFSVGSFYSKQQLDALLAAKLGRGEDTAFVFVQSTPAMVWTINHSLGFSPAVQIIRDNGNLVGASVAHPSTSTTTIVFSEAIMGIARLT